MQMIVVIRKIGEEGDEKKEGGSRDRLSEEHEGGDWSFFEAWRFSSVQQEAMTIDVTIGK
jgi:hypothetical protein